MTLLALYRGSKIAEVSCGTTKDDLAMLERYGYIQARERQRGGGYEPTNMGHQVVNALLAWAGPDGG